VGNITPLIGILMHEYFGDCKKWAFICLRLYAAVLNSIFVPVAAMTLRKRSLLIPARAPFLIADTFDLATPEVLTISLTVIFEFAMAFAAMEESFALYFIRAASDSEVMPRACANF